MADVGTPVSGPALDPPIQRVPTEILLKIFRYATFAPEDLMLERHPTGPGIGQERYINEDDFTFLHDTILAPIRLTCRLFDILCMISFYQVNMFHFGIHAFNHYRETAAKLPPRHFLPLLRRIRYHMVINDWYRVQGSKTLASVGTVSDLMQFSRNSRLLLRLTNVGGFHNLRSIDIKIFCALRFDPYIALSVLREANIKIKAGKVRICASIYHHCIRLMTTKKLFRVKQTEDDGDPFPDSMEPNVNFEDITQTSFVMRSVYKGEPRYRMHQRHIPEGYIDISGLI